MTIRQRFRARRSPARYHVHAKGGARLDAMLDLADEASRAAPIADVLRVLCARIAAMLSVEVCSIYLREAQSSGGDALVLGATFGYPEAAVGQVRMRIGEGLTGFAVECLRPVSVARATFDARNKLFPDLDEERFPSLCALPLVDSGQAVGALVIQRSAARAFVDREVVLLAAVASPVLWALERARTRAAVAARAAVEAELPPGRPQDVSLRGQRGWPVPHRERVLGTIVVRRRLGRTGGGGAPARDVMSERARLGRALADAANDMVELEAAAIERQVDRTRLWAALSPSRFVLDDARLREQMLEEVERGAAAEAAVESVMNRYARSLSGAQEPLLVARALEVEALCGRVGARLAGRASSALPPGTLLVSGRVTVCDALELAAAHGVGIALGGRAEDSSGIEAAVALGMPVVSGVDELFRWVADGDRALLDAAERTLFINPSRVDVLSHRRGK